MRVGRQVGRAGYISIHAPVKGATPSPHAQAAACRNFNPRSREGSDTAGEASWI